MTAVVPTARADGKGEERHIGIRAVQDGFGVVGVVGVVGRGRRLRLNRDRGREHGDLRPPLELVVTRQILLLFVEHELAVTESTGRVTSCPRSRALEWRS